MATNSYEPAAFGDVAAERNDEPAGAASSLWADRAFFGLTATQFLGAFNDNLFKQALLLLFVAVPVSPGSGQTRDLQGLATFCFSLPFILFSGYAGYLSDRNSKRRVTVICKVAEIAIMTVGTGLFALYSEWGLSHTLIAMLTVTLFCMGTHSAFFGPGKYGMLPELFRKHDLPHANGVILMTTFLAIIFGAALAGWMLDRFPGQLWLIGAACMGIAVLGTATALLIRPTPVAQPDLKFDPSALTVPHDIRELLRKDRPLYAALWASIMFWSAAAMVQLAVNSLGKNQLHESNSRTSLLVALISVGIAVGSAIAGAASKGRFNTKVLKTGLWGMVAMLFLLAPPGLGGRPHLLGYWGSVPTVVLLGIACGMFAVPLQVFMQSRPPKEQKGRMIATQNLTNWVGITASAGVYWAVNWLLKTLGLPPSGMFAFTGAMLLVVAVLYHPKDEALA